MGDPIISEDGLDILISAAEQRGYAYVSVEVLRAIKARHAQAQAEARGAWRPTHRHLKRGSVYDVERRCVQVQTSRPIVEGDLLVVYVGAGDHAWARLHEEFDDGRFEPLPPPRAGGEK